MDISLLVFQLVVLIFSVMIHEVSHGYAAERLGDSTARLMGRLTLNPLKHLDFFGSFLFPLLLYFSTNGAFVFGWAKPVPYDPSRLKNPQFAAGKIAAAGPASNILLALAFGILLRIFSWTGYASLPVLPLLFSMIIYLNILLAVFNLVPIPPLDGSKILFSMLRPTESNYRLMNFLEHYGFMLLILFIFLRVFDMILPAVDLLYILISGQPL